MRRIFVIAPLKVIFDTPAAGDGIIGVSYCRLLQFSDVFSQCVFKIPASTSGLAVRNQSSCSIA